ncbi:MAG: amidohydrolase family protein, partial [Thermoplasmata archaeon]|nr:amidohydrolase family protein [Thermoplasmata archaeon]
MKLEGKLYHQGEIKEAAIEIEDGKIKRIRKSLPSARKFKGIILPGALDLHVHFREPGFVYKEDFYTGTMSAAFGGVTFVMDMPNNSPAVITAENFMDKLRIVSPKANVDFSLYFMLTHHSSSLEEINGAFKYYMGETTAAEGREIKEFPKKSFISVHAELNECIRRKSTNLKDHDRARPERCEFAAVKSLLDYNIKFHIAHVSSIDTVDLCKIGSFTCEVTPHHLFLHKDMPLGAFGKVNPPLRAKWVSEQLWEELLSGRID